MKRLWLTVREYIGSWGLLEYFVFLIVLVLLGYCEEDWRGAHDWAAEKAKWEEKGETFDRTKFVPPPVPNDQNLAELPLFKLELDDSSGTSCLAFLKLKKAMPSSSAGLPSTGGWFKGEGPDMPAIHKAIVSQFKTAFKDTPPPDSTLAQLNALYPFITDLVSASATRPRFRPDLQYLYDLPPQRPLGPVVDQLNISKLLTLHAILALQEHRPDVALADLKLNQEFFVSTKSDPTLVGGLVAIGIRAVSNSAIFFGLTTHAWSEAQLAEIEQLLEPINLLADYQFTMRSEVVSSIATVEYLQRVSHGSGQKQLPSNTDYGHSNITTFFPDGWWDENKRQLASFNFREIAVVDPQARHVFPSVSLDLRHEADRSSVKWRMIMPWNFLYSMLSPPMSSVSEKFAQGQVSVDETRIACALERYRLAHGVYPATLAELAPACIDEVPHDIMNGDPYHYRLNADGTFLLYSVGWNQTDDGGTVAFNKYNKTSIDYENGDWVWPTAKR